MIWPLRCVYLDIFFYFLHILFRVDEPFLFLSIRMCAYVCSVFMCPILALGSFRMTSTSISLKHQNKMDGYVINCQRALNRVCVCVWGSNKKKTPIFYMTLNQLDRRYLSHTLINSIHLSVSYILLAIRIFYYSIYIDINISICLLYTFNERYSKR